MKWPRHSGIALALAFSFALPARLAAEDSAATEEWKAQLAERSGWWSLQAPKKTDPPRVDDPDWSREPVDRFVRSALDEAGLEPAEPANAEVLLRRLSFVLTGLPPKPQRVGEFREAFAKSPDRAVEELVDELLASPHFGERIARHWMDVVRYTDTYGYEWDIAAKGSWEYRDYLIRAFNADIGYDQLVREQIAGDLLAEPRINDEQGINESLIGPMFYHFGEHRHGSSLAFNGIHQEMIDNKIDAFSKTFLAMTVACARCHDHKLDAISQADYYALAGVFMTPRWTARSIDAPGKNDAVIAELKDLRREIRDALAKTWTSTSHLEPAALKAWARDHRETLTGLKLDDIAYPFQKLEAAGGDSIPAGWNEMATEWRTTCEARLKANAGFEVIADFDEPGFPANWSVEGDGLRHGHVDSGTPRISLEDDSLIAELLPAGHHTHALSSKLPGALRLPEPDRFPRPKLSLKLAGGEWAGRREIPQNAFLNEGPKFFDPAKPPTWTTVATPALKNGVTRVLTEITTASLNSNFPPRTGVAKSGKVTLPSNDGGFDKRSWFSVSGIVAHEGGGTPADTLECFAPLLEGDTPGDSGEAWQRLSGWLSGTVERWSADEATDGDVRVLNWLLAEGMLANDATSAPEVAALVDRYRELENRIDFPRSANSMDESGIVPVDYRLNVRGDVYENGAAIRRDFLEVFAGRHGVGEAEGSGRLPLAEYLASPENPQTARVFVNRVWYWIFGTGIVTTPSDFGKLGGRPSHPELLDWLALRFMEEGWSTKQLVRRLVLSRTFRQSGQLSAHAAERDPDNRLLHHYPTRRLEAEAIRDALLAVSGRLDPQLFGRPVKPPRKAEDAKKRLFSGPLDSHGRRSIYLEMSIMQPPEFLVGFNLPDLKLPTGRRDVTNVPAQALIMLNDPMVQQLAAHWADRLLSDGHGKPEARIRDMFVAAFARSPGDAELDRWLGAVDVVSEASERGVMADRAAWTDLAHTLFNTKEFLYYR